MRSVAMAFLVGMTIGCNGGGDERIDEILALTGDAASGESLYAVNCASCHGAEGEGDIGPSLEEHIPHHDDEYLLTTILDGASGMTAFATLLEPQQHADLLAYLRATWGEHEGDH